MLRAMPRRSDPLDKSTHRKSGAYLFNLTWDLLAKKRRTAGETDELIHAAHASRYHWGRAGRPLNLAIGEWQLSRVYASAGRSEPALHHARLSLAIVRRHRLAPFYLAYAHEALARAHALNGARGEVARELRAARRAGAEVRNKDDRRMLEEDLATIG